jgi:anthranilate phosphoribosyltransferase
VTSSVGSADVIEALGIRADLSPVEAARSLHEHNFAFFFAPNFHPAFKNIAPARKLCAERGQRTIFNILGPLLNPARPSAALVGVSRTELCEPMARALQSLGLRRAMVACGEAEGKNLDELSTLGVNHIAEFYQERGFAVSNLSPENFPVQPATLADLRGGDKSSAVFCTAKNAARNVTRFYSMPARLCLSRENRNRSRRAGTWRRRRSMAARRR